MRTQHEKQAVGPAEPSSLVASIVSLHSEFASMKDELQSARTEISRMSVELNMWRRLSRIAAQIDARSLRRGVAFHCHPDRGGDANVMCNVNMVCDMLDSLRKALCETAEGSAVQ